MAAVALDAVRRETCGRLNRLGQRRSAATARRLRRSIVRRVFRGVRLPQPHQGRVNAPYRYGLSTRSLHAHSLMVFECLHDSAPPWSPAFWADPCGSTSEGVQDRRPVRSTSYHACVQPGRPGTTPVGGSSRCIEKTAPSSCSDTTDSVTFASAAISLLSPCASFGRSRWPSWPPPPAAAPIAPGRRGRRSKRDQLDGLASDIARDAQPTRPQQFRLMPVAISRSARGRARRASA
jgi:hypothetical protein